jgi:hypothetical protein
MSGGYGVLGRFSHKHCYRMNIDGTATPIRRNRSWLRTRAACVLPIAIVVSTPTRGCKLEFCRRVPKW